MKLQYIAFISLSLIVISCTSLEKQEDYEGIRKVLAEQQEAWNQGDIELFMEGYVNSENLRFMSSGNINRGWDNTLERYQKSYPDKDAMGILKFEILEIFPIEKNSAALYGTYHLTRKNDEPSGFFNLIFKKVDGNWRIISDMTCSN